MFQSTGWVLDET